MGKILISKKIKIIIYVCSIILIISMLLGTFSVICYFIIRNEWIDDLKQKGELVKNDFNNVYELKDSNVDIESNDDYIYVKIQADYSIIESYKLKFDKNHNLISAKLDSLNLIFMIFWYLVLLCFTIAFLKIVTYDSFIKAKFYLIEV